MSQLLDTGAETVKDGESPIYTEDSSMPRYTKTLDDTRRGYGYAIDAQTVSGIEAVTAAVGGPNKLVATGSTGLLSSAVLPTTGTTVTTSGGGAVPAPVTTVTLVSNNLSKNAVLSVNTDGTLSLTSSVFTSANITYLTNGVTTYWITFTPTDTVLSTQTASSITTATSFTLVDANLYIWNVTIDSDGVLRTTNVGSI